MDWLHRPRRGRVRDVDVLGMTGGDGRRRWRHPGRRVRLPMVVEPTARATTLPWTLADREDVVATLDAYGEAVERTTDLAD